MPLIIYWLGGLLVPILVSYVAWLFLKKVSRALASFGRRWVLALLMGAMSFIGVCSFSKGTNGTDNASSPTNGVESGSFPTNGAPLVGSWLRLGSNAAEPEDDGSIDEPRIGAISVTSAGVDLVLHRPASLAAEAVTVTLAGSTNLVAATWESYFDVTFPAGVTNVPVSVSSAQLTEHAVAGICFFAFTESGDPDQDGLPTWFERYNSKTLPDFDDSDMDGLPDGWEWENGLLPNDPSDVLLDPDEDGLTNLDELGLRTHPQERDTDGDGLDDREEYGWIEPRGTFPDLSTDASTVYICSSPQGHVSQGVYPFDLPFPVSLCGRICTRGFADVHGVLRLVPAEGPTMLAPLGDNGPLPSADLAEGLSVAAYWDSLGLRGSGVSSIRLTDKTIGGRRYAVVEYNSVDAGDFDLLTFRVAVCADTPDEVVVQYVSLDDPNEGQTATFGAQGPGGWPRLLLSCDSATPVCAGFTFVYHLGTGTDPANADTDGDGMSDGWELAGGLLPNSPDGDDGAAGDPDGDGLSNWLEYVLGTLPFDPHTFEDDVVDADWVAWGFGMPFPDFATVRVSVGDPSTSHSERWRLTLDDLAEGGRHYAVVCTENGEVASRTLHLERGRDFVGRLEHLGTSLGTPDYDWTARVCGWPVTPVLPQGGVQTVDGLSFEDLAQGVVVYNLDGLLGVCDDTFGAYDNTVGKTFLVHTAKTQVEPARACVHHGFPHRTQFSLSDDSDSLADWTIEPVTSDGPRLYTSPFGGEGVTSLQGVSRVYVSTGADAALYTVRARHPTFVSLCSTAAFAVCRFQVEGVRFNTNEYGSSRDAINIRSSHDEKGFDYETGEWANGGLVNFPVCYRGGVLPRIQARFSVTPALTMSARFFAQQTTAGSPLGGLIDDEVQFTDGVSGWKTFTGVRTVETMVRRSEASFGWHFCGIDGFPFPPTPFGTTGPHRVYTILADPVEPWTTTPAVPSWPSFGEPDADKQMVWTNALEWACSWAEGETSQNGVASKVAAGINVARLEYGNSLNHGGCFMYENDFGTKACELSRFIRHLNDVNDVGHVNCVDCSNMVLSFSNLLGCNLWSVKLYANFKTNPVKLIGSEEWTEPVFSMHAIAWYEGTGTGDDLVYDACLKYGESPLDKRVNPTLPIAIRFSDGSPEAPFAYRERLTPDSPEGYDSCDIDPTSRRRMQIE